MDHLDAKIKDLATIVKPGETFNVARARTELFELMRLQNLSPNERSAENWKIEREIQSSRHIHGSW